MPITRGIDLIVTKCSTLVDEQHKVDEGMFDIGGRSGRCSVRAVASMSVSFNRLTIVFCVTRSFGLGGGFAGRRLGLYCHIFFPTNQQPFRLHCHDAQWGCSKCHHGV